MDKKELKELREKSGAGLGAPKPEEAAPAQPEAKEKHWTERFTDASIEFQANAKKDASGYGYKYMPLETMLSVGRPIFKKHRLGFIQRVIRYIDAKEEKLVGKENIVETRLVDLNSGEMLMKSLIDIPVPEVEPKKNFHQAVGSAMTYMRRYALACLLGIQPEKDDDGEAAGGGGDRQPEYKGKPVRGGGGGRFKTRQQVNPPTYEGPPLDF